MIRRFFFLFLIFSCPNIIGQINTTEIQKNIDRTVWASFQKAYESLDSEALNAIYADEVLRVTPKGIDTQNEFKRKNRERFEASKENKTRMKLDFWFDNRHTNEDTSYEVGFYKITVTINNKVQYIYGQFHIVLKKIKDQWKIIQDWDTSSINGKSIIAEDFNRREPLKF